MGQLVNGQYQVVIGQYQVKVCQYQGKTGLAKLFELKLGPNESYRRAASVGTPPGAKKA